MEHKHTPAPMPEPAAEMYPSDLKTFEFGEHVRSAFSIRAGNADTGEVSVGLYTAGQMEAYAAAKVQEILHEEAKPDNIKRAEYYGEGYADGWKAALGQAAQLCDAQHFGGDNDDDLGWTSCAANLAHAIRALIPSTPA